MATSSRIMHKLILGGLFYFFENAFFRLFIPYCKKYVEGEIVLVTGAANGIEKLIAKELGHHRATLVLWDINSGTGQDSQRIKIHFLEAPANLVDRILRVNVAAHFWTYKAFLPALLQRNHGHLVCVACHGGLFVCKYIFIHKSAAMSFAESIVLELLFPKKEGIKTAIVNTDILPLLRRPSFLPILDQRHVAKQIVDAIYYRRRCIWVLVPSSATKSLSANEMTVSVIHKLLLSITISKNK
uniref:Uncharacterized protein n=1 Tax=Cyprinus carpio carpio TaxID=630221 RepID=A0A8C1AFI7_CYPCA